MKFHIIISKILFFILFVFANDVKSQTLYDFTAPPESQVQLEILLTSSSLQSIDSAFGHMSLRLKFKDQEQNQFDYVLSFLANDGGESGILRDIKAVSGMYETILKIDTFKNFISKNSIQDDRQIRRFILPSNSIIDKKLFSVLAESISGNISFDKFFFFTNNSARNLYTFLGKIGFYINKNIGNTNVRLAPIQHISILLNPVLLGLIELPPISSIFELNRNIYKKYNIKNIEEPSELKKAIQGKLKEMSVVELNVFLKFNLSDLPGLKAEILRELATREKILLKPIDELLGNFQLNEILYLMCMNKECVSNQAKSLKEVFTSKKIIEIKLKIKQELSRSMHLIYAEDLEKTSQFQYAVWLEKSL